MTKNRSGQLSKICIHRKNLNRYGIEPEKQKNVYTRLVYMPEAFALLGWKGI